MQRVPLSCHCTVYLARKIGHTHTQVCAKCHNALDRARRGGVQAGAQRMADGGGPDPGPKTTRSHLEPCFITHGPLPRPHTVIGYKSPHCPTSPEGFPWKSTFRLTATQMRRVHHQSDTPPRHGTNDDDWKGGRASERAGTRPRPPVESKRMNECAAGGARGVHGLWTQGSNGACIHPHTRHALKWHGTDLGICIQLHHLSDTI